MCWKRRAACSRPCSASAAWSGNRMEKGSLAALPCSAAWACCVTPSSRGTSSTRTSRTIPRPVSRLTSDVISLATYPLLLLGIWRLPRRPLSLSSHLRISLDGLMIMTAALAFSWYFIMGPAVLAAHQDLEAKIVSVAYPLADLLLIACLLLLGDGMRSLRPVVTLFSVGLLCIVTSDCVFSYRLLHGLWHNGSLLDIGWSLGFMPIGVAAAAAQRVPVVAEAADEKEGTPALWKSLLPYALLPCVAALILYTQHAPGSRAVASRRFVGRAGSGRPGPRASGAGDPGEPRAERATPIAGDDGPADRPGQPPRLPQEPGRGGRACPSGGPRGRRGDHGPGQLQVLQRRLWPCRWGRRAAPGCRRTHGMRPFL